MSPSPNGGIDLSLTLLSKYRNHPFSDNSRSVSSAGLLCFRMMSGKLLGRDLPSLKLRDSLQAPVIDSKLARPGISNPFRLLHLLSPFEGLLSIY